MVDLHACSKENNEVQDPKPLPQSQLAVEIQSFLEKLSTRVQEEVIADNSSYHAKHSHQRKLKQL
jgi:hypothetical protein